MDQSQQQQQQPQAGGVAGPAGRRLHIAHRRSPSELTPLMSMFVNPTSELPFARLLLSLLFFFLLFFVYLMSSFAS